MAKFIFLYRDPVEPAPPPSPEEMQKIGAQWYAWMQKFATSIVKGGDGLKPNGKTIRANGVVTDGPYIEAKEIIVSFTIVQADDYEGALAIARECPAIINGSHSVEIREFAGYS
jgi:hypothetical protein